jgi:dienelactone hydrolase
LVTVLLTACRAGPADDSAAPPLVAREVRGAGFVHEVFEPAIGNVVDSDAAAPLFVFFEGDGRPWTAQGTHPSANPDPLRAVALELATAQQATLLGRPCYHGHARDADCEATLWTDARYSEPVVKSMAVVLRQLIRSRPSAPAVLVGYSGGGALALLVADRVPEVRAVVTLAANLDLQAWTHYHGYQPLAGSLDPLASRALRPGCEIHIAAARDTVVPPSLVEAGAARRPGALFRIEPGADHACCWRSRWMSLLTSLTHELELSGCFAA